jgi:transposase
MGRARNGQAIGEARRTPSQMRALKTFVETAEAAGDLDAWRRGRCVLRYLGGEPLAFLAKEVGVHRSAATKWLAWYEADGVEGLRTRISSGRPPRLTLEQQLELTRIVEAGPVAAGFRSGVWTGALVGEWIREHFGVEYHPHHIPKMLHQLGFSVQRPRKRLARADVQAQAFWLRKTFPAIKKKRERAEG